MNHDPAYAESYPQYMTMDADADAERVAAGEPEDWPQSETYYAAVMHRHADLQTSMRYLRSRYPEKFDQMCAGVFGAEAQAAALIVAGEDEET